MPATVPQHVLSSLIHGLMQCNQDFSVRVPDTALSSRCVKAVFMDKPGKYFVLAGKSNMPTNGFELTQVPMIEGGDRYDCEFDNYNCVEKMAQFLCADSVE